MTGAERDCLDMMLSRVGGWLDWEMSKAIILIAILDVTIDTNLIQLIILVGKNPPIAFPIA